MSLRHLLETNFPATTTEKIPTLESLFQETTVSNEGIGQVLNKVKEAFVKEGKPKPHKLLKGGHNPHSSGVEDLEVLVKNFYGNPDWVKKQKLKEGYVLTTDRGYTRFLGQIKDASKAGQLITSTITTVKNSVDKYQSDVDKYYRELAPVVTMFKSKQFTDENLKKAQKRVGENAPSLSVTIPLGNQKAQISSNGTFSLDKLADTSTELPALKVDEILMLSKHLVDLAQLIAKINLTVEDQLHKLPVIGDDDGLPGSDALDDQDGMSNSKKDAWRTVEGHFVMNQFVTGPFLLTEGLFKRGQAIAGWIDRSIR